MNSWDDIQLVSRVAVLHDRRAFDTLVKRHQETIRRFFLNQTCGDTQLSDDLAQDTFVKAYLNIGQFQGKSNFGTWLFRIAYNVFYDYTRGQRPTTDIDLLPAQRLRTEQRGMEKNGSLPSPATTDGNRTHLRITATDGGTKHRPHRRDHRDERQHHQVALGKRKKETGDLPKSKRI